MKVLVKNYFPYEAEEILYDLERMKRQGFVLKEIIQNIYIFEPSMGNVKYFVYKIEDPDEYEITHKELTEDHWVLIKCNRNWAIYKTQQQDHDSVCKPFFLKNEVLKNIRSELMLFISFWVGWSTYIGKLNVHNNYGVTHQNIPPAFLSIEVIGYVLFVIALICLVTEIISTYKNQYKTSLRLPIVRKIYEFINFLLLSIGIYVICVAIMLITQSIAYSIIALGLVIYWGALYVLLGGSVGLVNSLTAIAASTFFILRIVTLCV